MGETIKNFGSSSMWSLWAFNYDTIVLFTAETLVHEPLVMRQIVDVALVDGELIATSKFQGNRQTILIGNGITEHDRYFKSAFEWAMDIIPTENPTRLFKTDFRFRHPHYEKEAIAR